MSYVPSADKIPSSAQELRYIYLLTAFGLTPGGSSTVHIYTQTIHRTTQKFWMGAGRAPLLCELYPGICLTTEKKHGETSVRVAEVCLLAR